MSYPNKDSYRENDGFWIILLVAMVAALMLGCGERSSQIHDRWMTELDCPVVLIGKTDQAAMTPSIVVRDGAGRVRTMSADNFERLEASNSH